MSIYLGTAEINSLKLGTADVSRVMLGNAEVWSAVDPDAADYFARIVAAGSSISVANKAAVDAFVRGCKADGIWSAIKASCLLAGPDDLTGALVPLVGAAPTNNGPFVSGDYNRTTGLLGNGTTKYLDSNRNNNADPQDSRHIYARITTAQLDTTVTRRTIGTTTASGGTFWGISTAPQIVTRCATSGTVATTATLSTGGVGVSRSNSSNYNRMNYGSVASVSGASVTPASQIIGVFGSVVGDRTNARLSFYSIGEYLDLALLDARLATYMSALT
jgi:hypothetical protein